MHASCTHFLFFREPSSRSIVSNWPKSDVMRSDLSQHGGGKQHSNVTWSCPPAHEKSRSFPINLFICVVCVAAVVTILPLSPPLPFPQRKRERETPRFNLTIFSNSPPSLTNERKRINKKFSKVSRNPRSQIVKKHER